MSATQFPPSSPLLDHHEADDEHQVDPFSSFSAPSKSSKKLVINSPFNKNTIKSTLDAYPTPNPSSSAGVRSSSPARHEQSTPAKPFTNVHDGAYVEYENPSHNMMKVALRANEKVTVGRSSRCDYFIKSKFASRVHLKLHFDAEANELTILCKGYNGVVIQFGTTYYGYISQIEDKLFEFTKRPQDGANEEDEVFTELSVFKDEQITVPYNDQLTLNLKGHIIRIHVSSNDDSETEDELPVLNKRLSSIEPSGQMKPIKTTSETRNVLQTPSNKPVTETEFVPVKHLSRSSTPILKSSEEFTPISFNNQTTRSTEERAEVISRSKSVEPQHSTKAAKPSTTTTVTPTTEATNDIHEKTHNRSKSADQKRVPLEIKSENALNKQARRRKAEPGISPQKKKHERVLDLSTPAPSLPSSIGSAAGIGSAKKRLQPREKIENLNIEQILSTIDDVDAIKNVLSNHLAFSRLSQTPLNQLQGFSASTQSLSREQLRAVLASTKCIGVIYRHGKDAAGKYLDEEYYYDVEQDDDPQRVQMVSSVKGASGLRNCRKTHKQYFWKKPVTKK